MSSENEDSELEEKTESELLPLIKEKLEEKIFKDQRLIITHPKSLIVSCRTGEKIEADFIVLDQDNNVSGAIHVKLNLGYPEDLKLLGKLNLSLKGVSKTWVAIEREINSPRFEEGIPKEVGIIRFARDKNNKIKDVRLEQEAKKTNASYLRRTQKIIKDLITTQDLDIRRYWLVLTSPENWEICKRNRVYGMPYDPITKKFEKTPIGSVLIIYVKKRGIVGCQITTSKMFKDTTPLGWTDNKGKPWLCEMRVQIFPVVTDDFPAPLKWDEIRNKMSRFKTGHPQGRVELTKNDYEQILMALLRKNENKKLPFLSHV